MFSSKFSRTLSRLASLANRTPPADRQRAGHRSGSGSDSVLPYLNEYLNSSLGSGNECKPAEKDGRRA